MENLTLCFLRAFKCAPSGCKYYGNIMAILMATSDTLSTDINYTKCNKEEIRQCISPHNQLNSAQM